MVDAPTNCPLPACRAEMKRHCPESNTYCGWLVCSSCRITLDPRKWLAFGADWKPVALPSREG